MNSESTMPAVLPSYVLTNLEHSMYEIASDMLLARGTRLVSSKAFAFSVRYMASEVKACAEQCRQLEQAVLGEPDGEEENNQAQSR